MVKVMLRFYVSMIVLFFFALNRVCPKFSSKCVCLFPLSAEFCFTSASFVAFDSQPLSCNCVSLIISFQQCVLLRLSFNCVRPIISFNCVRRLRILFCLRSLQNLFSTSLPRIRSSMRCSSMCLHHKPFCLQLKERLLHFERMKDDWDRNKLLVRIISFFTYLFIFGYVTPSHELIALAALQELRRVWSES